MADLVNQRKGSTSRKAPRDHCTCSPIPLSATTLSHNLMALVQKSQVSRDRLISLVAANPGIHVRRLAMLTGMSWNNCQHHLRSLERNQQITSRKVDGRVCWFDRRHGAHRGKAATVVLRDPINKRIATAIRDHPGIHQQALAEQLDLAASVVHRRVIRLVDTGLVLRHQDSRRMILHAAASLEEALAPAYSTPFVGFQAARIES